MIRTWKLGKSYGNRPAVVDLDLEVRPGEIYGLVGPDGAGKTTTIRLLCGALRPTSGQVEIAGVAMERSPEEARRHVGYLSQHFSLYDDLTVEENLQFFAEVRGLPGGAWHKRSAEILAFVGLEPFAGRLARHLSGGMKQKLSLAVALVAQPRVLLLDEPTTGVDPLTRQDFWQLIIRLVGEEHITVLLSTPYMDEATRCTRVGFLREGRLVIEGTPRSLRQLLAGRVMELSGTPEEVIQRVLSQTAGVLSAQRFGDRLHLLLDPHHRQEAVEKIIAGVEAEGGQIVHLGDVEPLLEDVFIALSEGFL
ncbi:MAG TPA: multidrug ABC transporter ATP-binding protein [Anaerolinea thermolimosa]|uniref:Multidrug ABC transporter ATP-binding protein n=1 Tax=Anaerolinea thermolimosa TaxID=229919 RepID=A0A3D1JFB2_9CHLR|nr:multidrug ABC transporter ATP-binding protein [Anaerolinea thermolimosa]